jgi:predicted nucleotidyltransferase
MVKTIEQHYSELVRLCEKYRVRKLEVFGSAATGEDFDPQTSDLDFLVEYQPLESDGYASAYFGLLEELQKLFDCPVDLVMTRAVRNKYFLRSIASSRTTVYAA